MYLLKQSDVMSYYYYNYYDYLSHNSVLDYCSCILFPLRFD